MTVNLDRDSFGKGPLCLIIDNTTLTKTGQLIEEVSQVFDHVSMRKVLGFKLLVLSYWDGISHIPIDFTMHREKRKNKDFSFHLNPGKFIILLQSKTKIRCEVGRSIRTMSH